MSEMRRHYLMSCLRSYAISFGISIPASFFMATSPNINPWLMAPIFGFTFGTVVILSHLVSHRLRHRSFLLTCLLQAFGYVAVIVSAFGVAMWSYLAANWRLSPFHPRVIEVMGWILGTPSVWLSIFGSFMLMFAIGSFFQISKKLGPGVLWNWMTGRYHEPREETRIFMFLDLKDSTMLAEKLGAVRFSSLVRDFFQDLTVPAIETRAEVSHYIGDEAVLTWRLDRGLKNANCIEIFFKLSERIAARRAYYLEAYGVVPGFKAGAHVGPVVATEVGDIKSEIVYHGDVLNTAARIQGHCNELGSGLLVSADLLEALGPAKFGVSSLELGSDSRDESASGVARGHESSRDHMAVDTRGRELSRDHMQAQPFIFAEFKGDFLFKGKEHEVGVYAISNEPPMQSAQRITHEPVIEKAVLG